MKNVSSVEEIDNRNETRSIQYRDGNKTQLKPYTISIIGLGYVGLPLALQALRKGYAIKGIDINTRLIETMRSGQTPSFLESDDADFFEQAYKKISFKEEIIENTDAFIVCVPTPVNDDKTPDLSPLTSAAHLIAPHIKKGMLVVIESTVNPGVCEECVLPILEEKSNLIAEKDFYFAHCPERINPGDSNWNVATIPRVLGSSGPKSDAIALKVYSNIIEAPITLMKNIKEAEAVKMVENTFRDINIAFVNELAMSFTKAGIDTQNVLRGASTKPFGFMLHNPGCGVGGHCIPVDPYYLIAYGQQNGFHHRFLEIAREINNNMPEYTVSLLEEKLKKHGKTLEGSKISLLGLSYKKDVPDLRESPALEIKSILEHRGAYVASFDPLLPHQSSSMTMAEALKDSCGIIVATNHSIFEHITPDVLHHHKISILVDGRNFLNKELFLDAGIDYIGIGR